MMHQIRIDDETSHIPFYANFGSDEHVPLHPSLQGDIPEKDGSNVVLLRTLLVLSIFGIIITAPKFLQRGERDDS